MRLTTLKLIISVASSEKRDLEFVNFEGAKTLSQVQAMKRERDF